MKIVLKDGGFILMRQEDSDFYKSEMNCRQPVRADFFLTTAGYVVKINT